MILMLISASLPYCVDTIERFSIECLKSLYKFRVKSLKCGKTRVTKSWLVVVLYLIGLKNGASFLDQSQSEVKQKPKQSRITFDTQFKISLFSIYL